MKKDGIYFDGTVGGGGHSYEILKRTSPFGRVIATDLDDEAIRAATGAFLPLKEDLPFINPIIRISNGCSTRRG